MKVEYHIEEDKNHWKLVKRDDRIKVGIFFGDPDYRIPSSSSDSFIENHS